MRENGQPIWPNLRFHVNCSSAHNSWPWIWIFSATIDIPKRRRRIPGNVIRAYTTYYVSEGFVRCYRPCQYNIIHRGTARKKRKGKAIRKRMASEVLTRWGCLRWLPYNVWNKIRDFIGKKKKEIERERERAWWRELVRLLVPHPNNRTAADEKKKRKIFLALVIHRILGWGLRREFSFLFGQTIGVWKNEKHLTLLHVLLLY